MTKNNSIDNDVIKAWRKAAKDLELKIQSPFLLTLDDGQVYEYGLLIEDFGSDLGTLVLTTFETMDDDEPEKYGFHSSALNPSYYSKYDRNEFIDTLNEWGYYGDTKSTPKWYSGHSYNQDH
jgi:hypothetical protein